jgi:hypothetical protein
MFYRTESKPQGWRALAVTEDGTEHLIYLGRSSYQVRSGYTSAYMELLSDEERERVKSIALQRWNGAPDAGRWVQQTTLTIPSAAKLAKTA